MQASPLSPDISTCGGVWDSARWTRRASEIRLAVKETPDRIGRNGLQRNVAGLLSGELRGVPQGYMWVCHLIRCTGTQNKTSNTVLFWVVLCHSALPEDVIKVAKDVKPVTEIQQTGNDFVVTSKTPGKTVTNSFTIGKEAEITSMSGQKFKVFPVLIIWVRGLVG